jgi:hypothetical protein
MKLGHGQAIARAAMTAATATSSAASSGNGSRLARAAVGLGIGGAIGLVTADIQTKQVARRGDSIGHLLVGGVTLLCGGGIGVGALIPKQVPYGVTVMGIAGLAAAGWGAGEIYAARVGPTVPGGYYGGKF